MRRRVFPVLLGMSIAVAGSLLTAAQEMTMPKVLELQREFIKPGKAGMIHDKSESNFVQAMTRAKWPTHYLALNSMSGKSRALYITGYDSFAAWQKDNDSTEKNATLSAEIDHTEVSDGELLDGFDQAVLTYRDDLSFHTRPDLTNQKYIEIVEYHVRPGFTSEWSDEIKAVIEAQKKAGTNANWAMYHLEYGGDGGVFILFSADTGLDEIDTGDVENKKFRDAMGEDGMKKLEEVEKATIESTDSELFSINPKQSYPPDAWVKGNPDFWKPKPMSAAAKPASMPQKPAQ